MPGNDSVRIKKTRWFVSLFTWWVLAAFVYLFIAAKSTDQIGQVTENAIAVVLENAAKASLPLLERDVQALTGMVQEVAKGKGVVNISIVDHRNKIIAYTDPEQPIPPAATSVKRKTGVRYWPHALDDGTPAFCFAADINFADTKIGEVFLTMATGNDRHRSTVFAFAAIFSFFGVVGVLLVLDYRGVTPLKAAVKERFQHWMGAGRALPAEQSLICPLCGCYKPLTRSFFLDVNLDRFPVVRPAGNATGRTRSISSGINLRDVSRREDLGWLRRQMIIRCADIIKKLAGD